MEGSGHKENGVHDVALFLSSAWFALMLVAEKTNASLLLGHRLGLFTGVFVCPQPKYYVKKFFLHESR